MQREQTQQKTISKQNYRQNTGMQDEKTVKTINVAGQKEKQKDDKEKIVRILSRPRSKRYVGLIQKNIQLNQRFRELEARRKALTGKPEKEAEKGWWETPKEASETPALDTAHIEEIDEEMSQIQQEIIELGKMLERETPICSKRLGFIYSTGKEQELISRGIISAPGEPYSSLPELFDQVQPQTEHEKNQWKTANQAYDENCSETLLVVEIYWAAVCVVWDDGSVKCYQD